MGCHGVQIGVRNYPAYTPPGGFLIEDLTVFNSERAILAKNDYGNKEGGYNPFFEDGKDGRTSDRYTIRGAVFIGNKVAITSANGPSRVHVEKSVIAPKPPAALYPLAAMDADPCEVKPTDDFKTAFPETYELAFGGFHYWIPARGDDNPWSITLDDETLAKAKEYGFQDYDEMEADGVAFHPHRGTPDGPRFWKEGAAERRASNNKCTAFTGQINKFYHRESDCLAKQYPCSLVTPGMQGTCYSNIPEGAPTGCHRDAVVFPRPN